MENAEKLSITLPAEMVRMIRTQVEAGTYSSNSEAIRDALRPWIERQRKLAALDEKIMEGLADLDAGKYFTADEVLERIKNRYPK